jgi:hypothetical protein
MHEQDTIPDPPPEPSEGMQEIPQELRDDFARIMGAPVSDDVIRLAATMNRAAEQRWTDAGRARVPALSRDMASLTKLATALHRAATHPGIDDAARMNTMAAVAWVMICEAVQGVTELQGAREILKRTAPKPRPGKAQHPKRTRTRRK